MRSRFRATSRLLAVAWVIGGCATTTPDPGCIDSLEQAPAVDLIDPATLIRHLRDAPRTNPERFERLRGMFAAAGCESHLSVQAVPKARQPNLICELPGARTERIVVGAHFDKVASGRGVADNWSGAALLAALYQGLARTRTTHTFVFIGFSDEEHGELGSKAFVDQLHASELDQLVAMINLDTLGLGDTRFEPNEADAVLADLLVATASATGTPLSARGNSREDHSDHEPFRAAGIPAIRLHSLTRNSTRVVHSGGDRFEAIDTDAYYASYRLTASYLAVVDDYATMIGSCAR